MAYLITEECIDCNACEVECPNDAIYTGGSPYELHGQEFPALDDTHTYIAYDKCTECVGYYDEAQCVSVCPCEAVIKDSNHSESHEELLAKKEELGTILK